MFVTLPCKTSLMSIEEPLSFIDSLPYPEEISFHLSFNKIASTFLSSGDRSGLIWMFCGRDWRLESRLQIHAIELRVTIIGLGRCLSLSHFPILWQSLILCGPPTLSASKVDTLSKSLFRHWGRERPCCCSATPNRKTLRHLLSAVEKDWVRYEEGVYPRAGAEQFGNWNAQLESPCPLLLDPCYERWNPSGLRFQIWEDSTTCCSSRKALHCSCSSQCTQRNGSCDLVRAPWAAFVNLAQPMCI